MANEMKYENQIWGEPISGERLSTNSHYTGELVGSTLQDAKCEMTPHLIEETIVRCGTVLHDAIEGSTPKVSGGSVIKGFIVEKNDGTRVVFDIPEDGLSFFDIAETGVEGTGSCPDCHERLSSWLNLAGDDDDAEWIWYEDLCVDQESCCYGAAGYLITEDGERVSPDDCPIDGDIFHLEFE